MKITEQGGRPSLSAEDIDRIAAAVVAKLGTISGSVNATYQALDPRPIDSTFSGKILIDTSVVDVGVSLDGIEASGPMVEKTVSQDSTDEAKNKLKTLKKK